MMTTTSDRETLAKQLQLARRARDVLREQKAGYGTRVPVDLELELEAAEVKFAKLDAEVARLDAEYYRQRNAELEREVEKYRQCDRQQFEQHQRQIEELQQQVTQIEEERQGDRASAEQHRQQVEELQERERQQTEQHQRQIEELQQQIARSEENWQGERASAEQYRQQVEELQQQVAQTEEERQGDRASAEQHRQQTEQYSQQVSQLEQQVEALETEKEALQRENEKLKAQLLHWESNCGVDYTRLRDLLAKGKWQEADRETISVMREVAGKKTKMLDISDIDNLLLFDLRTIDNLWVKHSKGNFGFSIQSRIYFTLGGTKEYNREVWENFSNEIGWLVKGKLLSSTQIFSLNSCKLSRKGYLPYLKFPPNFKQRELLLIALFYRAQKCANLAT